MNKSGSRILKWRYVFFYHILGLRNWWYIISNLAQRKIGRMATKWCPRSKSQSWGPHNSNFTLVYAITVVYDTQITSNNYMVLYYTLDLIQLVIYQLVFMGFISQFITRGAPPCTYQSNKHDNDLIIKRSF